MLDGETIGSQCVANASPGWRLCRHRMVAPADWFGAADGGGLVVLRVTRWGLEFPQRWASRSRSAARRPRARRPRPRCWPRSKPTHAERLAEAMAIPRAARRRSAHLAPLRRQAGAQPHLGPLPPTAGRLGGARRCDPGHHPVTGGSKPNGRRSRTAIDCSLRTPGRWCGPHRPTAPSPTSVRRSRRVRGFTPAEAMSLSIEQTHPPATAAGVVDFYRRLFAAVEAGTELPVFRGEQEYYPRTARSWWARSR